MKLIIIIFHQLILISDLISHNDLDSRIRDTFDIQHYITLKNTNDKKKLSQAEE